MTESSPVSSPQLQRQEVTEAVRQETINMAGVLPPRDPWPETIAEVVPAIVNIVASVTSGFSTGTPGTGRATGFVVSTEYGLILTNRHVIGEGPSDAYAIFGKGALKCRITPCYVDPIHDFTICKYDVTDLEGFEVKQIELRPELAKVGLEVRVIGNDTGEVLSILPGVISRLDRNPMHWDARRYNPNVTLGPVF